MYCEKQTYMVKGRRGEDGPVYVVVPLDRTGKERVLHRNLLLPCPYLVDERRTADVPLERKRGVRGTGQNTKHNHNGILTMTAPTVPEMRSLTCRFQRREQEQICIHVQQKSNLEERRETENLRRNLTSKKSLTNL